MSKFTIEMNDAHIERFVLNMLNLLKNSPGINFKKEGSEYMISSTRLEENLMIGGDPMTWEELIQDIELSEVQYENGEYLTAKELRDESANC